MAKKRLRKGIFLVFDGPDGSGKSTHSRKTADFLKKDGYDVVYTREPGGTPVGDKIRDILLKAKLDMPALTEMLLFEASRAALVKEVIRPALLGKKIVISDRFNMATLAYQGYGGGIPLEYIERLESLSLNGVRPDLTVVVDVGARLGLSRIKNRKRDRMESKKLSFHDKVRRGYLLMAKRDKDRVKAIKAEGAVEKTFEAVKREVMNVVRKYKRPG